MFLIIVIRGSMAIFIIVSRTYTLQELKGPFNSAMIIPVAIFNETACQPVAGIYIGRRHTLVVKKFTVKFFVVSNFHW